MIFEYILKIELSSIFRSDFGDSRAEVNHFRKSIEENKDNVKVIREWKFNDIIH